MTVDDPDAVPYSERAVNELINRYFDTALAVVLFAFVRCSADAEHEV